MTSSLGGIPLGKSAFNRASRSAVGRVRLRPSLDAVTCARALLEPRPDALPALVRLARALVAVVRRFPPVAELPLLDVPTTPCACRRWAPSAAARENMRSHSGHLNSCLLAGVVGARAISVPPRCRRLPDRDYAKLQSRKLRGAVAMPTRGNSNACN